MEIQQNFEIEFHLKISGATFLGNFFTGRYLYFFLRNHDTFKLLYPCNLNVSQAFETLGIAGSVGIF